MVLTGTVSGQGELIIRGVISPWQKNCSVIWEKGSGTTGNGAATSGPPWRELNKMELEKAIVRTEETYLKLYQITF